MCDPENITLFVHVQSWINYDGFCPLKLSPTKVTRVLDEVKVPGQVRKDVKQIILSDKGIIRGTEIDEPVPMLAVLEQNGCSMECASDHGRALVGHQVRFSNNMNISRLMESREMLHKFRQRNPFFDGRFALQVQQIVIPGMVDSLEKPPHAGSIVFGSGNQVSKSGGGGHVGRICGGY